MKLTDGLVALLVLTVSGCGGGSSPLPPPGSAVPQAAIYVGNTGSSSISVFNIGAETISYLSGEKFTLVPAAGSPFPVGAQPTALVVIGVTTQCGSVPFCETFYLAVASAVKKTISVYNLDSTGGVGSLVATTSTAYTPVAITGGNFIYVADGEGYVSAYHFSNNALTEIPGSPFAAGAGPAALSTVGGWLYVANSKSNDISGFSIDSATGALTLLPGSPFAAGTGPSSVMVSPRLGVPEISGEPDYFLIVTNYGSSDVSVYLVNSDGSVTRVPGSPFATGQGPSASTTVSSPAFSNTVFLYVSNSLSNNISGYRFDQLTGSLTPLTISPFPAGTGTSSLAAQDLGVFAANSASNDLSVFSANPSSGALVPIGGSPFSVGSSPHEVLFSAPQLPL